MPKIKSPINLESSSEGKRLSLEARENQLIALAYDLVEQRLRDGTATSQETTHFLKMGSTKERLEKQIMEEDRKLRKAKTDAIIEDQKNRVDYEEILAALKRYNGIEEEVYDEDIF